MAEGFQALDWLAQLVTHIPSKGEQMVRYYGYYSNKSRGICNKAGSDDQVPALVESAVSSTDFRRNWARLIQKIYQIAPLLCPKCQGSMKVISFIEDDALIKKIQAHLRLLDPMNHNDGYGFALMQVSCRQKRNKWPCFFYHCKFVQNRPTHLYQTFLRTALNPIGHTPCCMSYRVDTQLCLCHTWLRKKQLLILILFQPGRNRNVDGLATHLSQPMSDTQS